MDTIAVPGFDIDLLGHAYFAQAEALLHDIFDLMRHGEPPATPPAYRSRGARRHELLEAEEIVPIRLGVV